MCHTLLCLQGFFRPPCLLLVASLLLVAFEVFPASYRFWLAALQFCLFVSFHALQSVVSCLLWDLAFHLLYCYQLVVLAIFLGFSWNSSSACLVPLVLAFSLWFNFTQGNNMVFLPILLTNSAFTLS